MPVMRGRSTGLGVSLWLLLLLVMERDLLMRGL